MILAVFFRGKSLKQCPKGYTVCSKYLENSSTCITKEECGSYKEKEKVKKEEKSTKKKSKYDREAEADLERERAKEKGALERRRKAQKIIENLKMGIMIDPKTGETLGALNEGNVEQYINALRAAKREIGSDVLAQEGLPNLNLMLSILTSSSISGDENKRLELLEDYLQPLSDEIGEGSLEKKKLENDGKKIEIPGRFGSDQSKPGIIRNKSTY